MTTQTQRLLSAALLVGAVAAPAQANDAATLRQMKAQMAQMQAQIEAMERRLQEQEVQQQKAETQIAKTKEREEKLGDLVQVYGQANVSVDHRSGDWNGDDGTAINSNASRIGVKGKLQTSLPDIRLIYQAELRYETTDYVNGGPGSDSDTKQVEFREAYAGMEGANWGRLRIGRLATGYKDTGTALDPWTDNAPQARSGGRQGMSELHSSYFNNAADYQTPKFFGGLSGNAWYSTQFDDSNKPMHNTGTLRNYIAGQAGGLGAKYDNGTIFLGADWLDINAERIDRTGLENGSAWQVAGRYKFGPFNGQQTLSVSALYEDANELGLGRNVYTNLIYGVDRFRFIGAYGQNRDGAVYGEKDWDNWSIGMKYALNKRSELLAAWNQRMDNTDDKDFNTLTVGLKAKFGY
ncbi:MAG: porin [Lamprobacter sp.]|uniref:porin n=1 Tax=Lamprobacter sp. TaxID=3100796 RepID=UPI002B264530|nr:porin [Lamprobacter sp.]MEA3641786.1 porin [Lamprobacter sp.]